MTSKRMYRYTVSYDLIQAGTVEVDACSEDEAIELVMKMDVPSLNTNASGCDLVEESVVVSDWEEIP